MTKKGKVLLLPKKDKEGVPYLSYSQINTWKRSKREYIRQYMLGESSDNEGLQKYGDFGTMVGEALENDDYSKFNKTETKFLKTVPRYDEFEREIKLQMDGFYIKGYIDTNTVAYTTKGGEQKEVVTKIADYKTGDIAKKKADYESEDYIQLEIYSADIRQKTGKLPDEVKVYLIGRSGNAFNNEKLKLTNEFITITRDVTDEKVDKVLEYVQKVAEEISATYQAFLKLNI